MNLQRLGENGLLRLLTDRWRYDSSVAIGVGDDCAVLKGAKARTFQLFKTDAIVEGIHFTKNTSPKLIGRKALARVLSDIAAMGGTPRHAVITLGLPKTIKVDRVRKIYSGMEDLAGKYRVNLVGGETTRAKQLFLSIALIGDVKGFAPVLRSTARPGDFLWVTGKLGGSQSGKHLRFSPRLAEGQWLAKHKIATAMMDLSDGLGSDLPRLASASRVSCEIWESLLPRNKGVTVRQAQGDGEDYELLFTVPPSQSKKLKRLWPFSTPITCIGKAGKWGKQKVALRPTGYDHFKQR
jgi:thiamine-monophosphate kinase